MSRLLLDSIREYDMRHVISWLVYTVGSIYLVIEPIFATLFILYIIISLFPLLIFIFTANQ